MLPAAGIMPSERAVIYQVPNRKKATITSIEIVNLSNAQQSFTLYLSVSGTPIQFTPADTILYEGVCAEETTVRTLGPAMAIWAQASDDGVIAFIINGEEQ